jgi:hypothetical protein
MGPKWKIKHISGRISRLIVSSLFSNRSNFEVGIVAHVVTRDDIWFCEAIASTSRFVDEYLVVDSSKDEFANYNQKVLQTFAENKHTYIRKDVDQKTARQILHEKSKKKWILHLDGDMIAVDNGFNSADLLFDIIRNLKQNKYYDVYFPLLFMGDSFDVLQSPPYGYEDWIYSNNEKFVWTNRKLDLPRIPMRFRKILIDIPFFIHMNQLFSDEKYFEKEAAPMWQNNELQKKFKDYESFLQYVKQTAKPYHRPDNYIPYATKFGYLPSIVYRFAGKTRNDIISMKLNEIRNKIIPN